MQQVADPFSANAITHENLQSLVQDGRVHSRAYTNQAIFDLEIDRIFHRSWIYVGHESEVPKPGDYQARPIGRTPVILVRGKDNKVRVLVNRCRHRGAQVVQTESGNTRMFRCWYHGWTYELTGALAEVTEKGGYGPDFKTENMGLVEVPRVASHRGFVFASIKAQGESLAEFLGGAAAQFDMLVDASPTGEIFLDAGTNKTEYLGNWKLVGMDGYHPNFVHASVVAGWARNSESGIGAMHREDPFSDEALTLTRDYGNGHAMLDFRAQRLKSYKKHAEFLSKVPGGVKYVEDMHKAYGQERAELLISLSGDPHLGVFPNLQLIGNQVRIITPIAPGMTQVTMSMVRSARSHQLSLVCATPIFARHEVTSLSSPWCARGRLRWPWSSQLWRAAASSSGLGGGSRPGASVSAARYTWYICSACRWSCGRQSAALRPANDASRRSHGCGSSGARHSAMTATAYIVFDTSCALASGRRRSLARPRRAQSKSAQ